MEEAVSGRKRKEGKLIYEYLLVLAAVTAILLVSFGLMNYIARDSAMEEALQAGDLAGAARRMYNVFEDVLPRPVGTAVAEIKRTLIEAGGPGGRMSGARPTLVRPF